MKKVLLLVVSIALLSCSKSDDAETTPSTSAIAYFKATLNGQPLDYTLTDYATSAYGYSYYNGLQSGPGYFDKSYHYGSAMQPINATNYFPQISLTFNNMYNSNSDVSQTDAFYSVFETIPTNFITSAENGSLLKGIDVSYSTTSGVNYSTLGGSQTGSTMTVTSSKTGVEVVGGLKIITIVGTVNCKLYNYDDPSDVIVLTNGSYKLIFREAT